MFDHLAAGRPTFLAIDGVIRQVVEHGAAGIFMPPGDAQALALALSTNPDLAAATGRSARAYVETHFIRADQATAFVALLNCLASPGRRRPR